MKKNYSVVPGILLFIFIIGIILYNFNNKPQVSSKYSDVNSAYFYKISKMSLDQIKEIEILDKRNSKETINLSTAAQSDVRNIINLINSLKLYDLDGDNINDTQDTRILYEITIAEKEYYPPGVIFILHHSIWFRDKVYYFPDDIGSKFIEIIGS